MIGHKIFGKNQPMP